MNILDIVLICLVVIAVLAGFVKGFLNTLLSFMGTLVSLVAAFFLARPAATLLNNWFGAAGAIGNSLTGQISTFFTEFSNLTGAEILANHCNATGFMKSALSLFINPDVTYESNVVLSQNLGNYAGNVVLMAICTVVCFILIKIAIKLLSKLFDAIKKKSLAINGLDKTLGMIFGAVKGLLFVSIVFVIASLLQSIPAVANALDVVFENSCIGKPLYDFVTGFVNGYLKNIDFNTILSSMI